MLKVRLGNRLWFGAAVAIFAAVAVPIGALAQPPTAEPPAKLEDFQGAWVGHSVPGSVEMRAATLNIQLAEDGKFSVSWSNFEGEDQGVHRKVVSREQTLRFEPTRRKGVWRGVGSRDLARGASSWARLHGRTLTISIAAMTEDGQLEQQSYSRTLTSRGMRLSYRRLLDGQVARTMEIEFLKL